MIASQGLLHERYGGVVPEIASRRHLELLDAVVADALERAGATLDDVETVAVTRGPGLIGALLVGRLVGQGAGGGARGCRSCRSTTCTATWWPRTLGADPIEPPYLCLVASGGHTFLARVDDPRAYAVLGQTLDDAAGEAFDKGARLLGPRLSGRPRARPAGARGRPDGVRLPALARPATARLLASAA